MCISKTLTMFILVLMSSGVTLTGILLSNLILIIIGVSMLTLSLIILVYFIFEEDD